MKSNLKYTWTLKELESFYKQPLFHLISQAHVQHLQFHSLGVIQVCHLISVKTGGCPEDCKYCAQSSRYQTSVAAQPMMGISEVLNQAKEAIAKGSTRVCLGAAWREVKDNKQFENILDMINQITALGAEVCCTLGMLKPHQAKRLKEAGLYAYNHNLDSSENFYKKIITTRTYQERLETLDAAEKAGLSVCCGGILGMGETIQDRLEFLLTLANRHPHPDSVPLNRLSQIPGTPLEHQPFFSFWEKLRIIAITRLIMPQAMIRLSAGRIKMSDEEHALCFFAGANSIFAGEKLLTVSNTSIDQDEKMFELLGLKKQKAFAK